MEEGCALAAACTQPPRFGEEGSASRTSNQRSVGGRSPGSRQLQPPLRALSIFQTPPATPFVVARACLAVRSTEGSGSAVLLLTQAVPIDARRASARLPGPYGVTCVAASLSVGPSLDSSPAPKTLRPRDIIGPRSRPAQVANLTRSAPRP